MNQAFHKNGKLLLIALPIFSEQVVFEIVFVNYLIRYVNNQQINSYNGVALNDKRNLVWIVVVIDQSEGMSEDKVVRNSDVERAQGTILADERVLWVIVDEEAQSIYYKNHYIYNFFSIYHLFKFIYVFIFKM